MPTVVSYEWAFGDGGNSNEQNPIHPYDMAGEWPVVVIAKDSDGNTFIGRTTIYTYDYAYGDEDGPDQPLPSLTNKCYRTPVRPGDGFGPSEYMDSLNPGEDWIWPPSEKGTAIGYTTDQREIALVLNAKTQQIYLLNDETIWRDRVGFSYQEGNILKSQCHQKSYTAEAGEHVAIVHNETHSYFKPFNKDNKGAAGFDENGLPSDFQVDMEMHLDGDQVYHKRTVNVPPDGDIVFPEKLEGREIQLRTIMYDAPWLLTELQNDFTTIDKSARPSLREMTESQYQLALSSLPLFYIARNFFPLRNRATGRDATGTVANLVTGPDEREQSGVNFTAGNGASDTLPANADGDFTIMGWFNNMPTLPITLWTIGTLNIQILAGYTLRVSDGINPGMEVALGFNGTEWAHIAVVRDGLVVRILENKALLASFDLDSIEDYGTACRLINVAQGSFFDAMVLPRALNAEIEYYYDNVLRGGDEVLPDF